MWKWRSTYHCLENSAYFLLKIELFLTMSYNFERETAPSDSLYLVSRKIYWDFVIDYCIKQVYFWKKHYQVKFSYRTGSNSQPLESKRFWDSQTAIPLVCLAGILQQLRSCVMAGSSIYLYFYWYKNWILWTDHF